MSKSNLLKIFKERPINFIFVLMIADLVIFIFAIVSQTLILDRYHSLLEKNSEIIELGDQVIYFDEVLTMSSKMAATTGREVWIDRYLQIEPRLEGVIQRLHEYSHDKGLDKSLISQTDSSNKILVKLEHESFQLVRSGDADRALELLRSNLYQKNKESYMQGIRSFLSEVDRLRQTEVRQLDEKSKMNLFLLFVFVITLFVMWFFVFHNLKKWKQKVDGVNSEISCRIEELEIDLKEKEAKAVEQAKFATLGTLAGNMSHEINNPLSVILGRVTELEEEELSIEKRDIAIKDIAAMTQKLVDIVNAMRMFTWTSDIEEKYVFDLNSVLTDCKQFFKSVAAKDKIQIKFEGTSSEALVLANQSQVLQTVLNLISNAIDAAKNTSNKWILVKLMDYSMDYSDHYSIKVVDSGMGVSEAVKNKMMEPFFTTKKLGKGTGIGLSLARRFAQMNSGAIHYREECSNTTFELTLPKHH